MDWQIGQINKNIVESPENMVLRAEARQEALFESLVKTLLVAKSRSEDFCSGIFICGPSSSGKTTFAKRLEEICDARGFNTSVVSMDNYYFDCVDIEKKQREEGTLGPFGVDFETIDAYDIEFLRKQIREFIGGSEIHIPTFSFTTKKREASQQTIKRTGKDILFIEGIQAMNHRVYSHLGFDKTMRVFIEPFDNYDTGNAGIIDSRMIRFMRRENRDYHKRDASLRLTLDMWKNVVHGEENYIKPMIGNADFFFNSSFEYELPFLAGRMLKIYEMACEQDKEDIAKVINLEALRKVTTVSDIKIPENSIFNEFYF